MRAGGLREDAELAFRMEFYNTLNYPRFGNPGTALGTATFGVITQPSVAPRRIQLALKYLFSYGAILSGPPLVEGSSFPAGHRIPDTVLISNA